ncbi:septum site-determining protein MinD [Halobacillus andaensis]|uniref:Septum site-determining protein MinD n=1 Tax=Halobacillus andaensis TaxID=1176239 RepID=A0A917B6Z0_HALAA|nr:AAA family ATPase [Halobacillus andaensis]MBP2005081.1 pilus assembly protein CpaE [Halobacillus andaensis]GGF28733.1 septum site-determining protein MinD [Halobacillus andaensis]
MTNDKHQTLETYPLHEVIAVCGAVGGAGRTSVTVNLAASLAKKKRRIRIVDGDLQFGDTALALDLQPSLTVKDIAEREDEKNVHDYWTVHESGIELLAAPHRPEHADLMTADRFGSLIESLQISSDILVVDAETGLTERSLQVMEKADRILLVTTPRMAALKHTRLMAETLQVLDLKHKVDLIVNQFTADSVMKAKEMTELTGVENVHFLPYDYKRMPKSLDVGIPLVESNPKLSFSIEIGKLAEELFPNLQNTREKQSAVNKMMNRLKGSRGNRHEFISKTSIKDSRRS